MRSVALINFLRAFLTHLVMKYNLSLKKLLDNHINDSLNILFKDNDFCR